MRHSRTAVQAAELTVVAGRVGTSEDRCSGWPAADIAVLPRAVAAVVGAENTAVGSVVSARTAEE